MAWIESHQEIGQHPKTRKAARLAGTTVPTMVGHLHLIWHWALDFAQEGDISSFEPWQVEDAAMWHGNEGALFDALRLAGFIDATSNDACVLHDWHDYAGKLIDRRRADAERKRRDSAKNRPHVAGSSGDIQRNSDGTPTEGSTESIRNRNLNRTVTTNELTLAPNGANDRTGLTSIDGGKKAPSPIDQRFIRFWQAYPKKRNKADAIKVWKRLKPDDAMTERMIQAVATLEQTNDWRKEGGQYIPYPAKWLNAGGWDDELPGTVNGHKSYDIRDYTPDQWASLAYGPTTTPEEQELSRQAMERVMG